MKKNSVIRIVIASLLCLVSYVLMQTIASMVRDLLEAAGVPIYIGNVVAGIVLLVLGTLVLKLVIGTILKIKLKEIGAFKKAKFFWIIVGIILPIAVVGTYLFLGGEWITLDKTMDKKLAIVTFGVVFSGIAVAFLEELIFRGIFINVFEKKWNKTVAVVISSLIFGALHLINLIGASLSVMDVVLVIVAGLIVGVMFSFIYLENHSVLDSAIVHALWNIVMVGGIIVVSDSKSGGSLFTYVLKNKSFLLTGGEFGIESSVVAVAGYVIVIVLAVIRCNKRKKATK